CTVTRDGAVRLGLGYVLGVRADGVTALVAARDAAGPFRSLDDLAARAAAGRPALEQLAWSGACDSLVREGPAPRTPLWQLAAAAGPTSVLVDRIVALGSPGREDAPVHELTPARPQDEPADTELAPTGTDDFRAVAPAVMSFAHGRRR